MSRYRLKDILGLRHDERRHGERRHSERGAHERRRADRRRRTIRGVVFGMFAMSIPGVHLSSKLPTIKELEGVVSTSVDYRAVPAAIAYNDAIAEAADLYELDPN